MLVMNYKTALFSGTVFYNQKLMTVFFSVYYQLGLNAILFANAVNVMIETRPKGRRTIRAELAHFGDKDLLKACVLEEVPVILLIKKIQNLASKSHLLKLGVASII